MEYIQLNTGYNMPALGFGTWDVHEIVTVEKAIECGYRLFDTAEMYHNEEIVGEAVERSHIDRKEFFITTKLSHSYSYDEALKAIDRQLTKLKTSYVDLMLIHEPYSSSMEIYRALSEAKGKGLVKSIGISNFHETNLRKLINKTDVIPSVDQVEAHVYFNQRPLHDLLDQHHIVMEAWAPFTEGIRPEIFKEPILNDIGHKYHKSASQIALKYLLELGIVVIVKSDKVNHMRENMDIFDFHLTNEEMKRIETLDGNQSLFNWYAR